MTKIVLILFMAALASAAHAIDYSATNATVWRKHLASEPPPKISESLLKSALEWKVFGGPVPNVNSATHYGLRLKWWNRVIGHMGLAAVADDYMIFLVELKAELARNNHNQANKSK